jgi:hypothetical protein
MGPRSIDHGTQDSAPCRRAANGLQWGRDQLIAGLDCGHASDEVHHVLQWGRDQLIAGLQQCRDMAAAIAGFNGAAIN